MDYSQFADKYKGLLETRLREEIARLEAPESLKKAMDYSLQAGGKRIRPMLLFAAAGALGENPEKGLSTACALEMIHTYSLIHDDLPSMDDDDLRRGKPTNHKVFGEAVAILAGDALLTLSFELVSSDSRLDAGKKAALIGLLAKSAGPEGMVGGQVADIEGENRTLTLADLEYIHLHKTGRLLTFSVMAGAIIGGADEKQLALFEEFSDHLGLAFQIRDDILDVEGDEALLGKPVGSDEGRLKSTYPSLLTMDGAKKHLASHTKQAKEALRKLNLDTGNLEYLTGLIAGRNH